MQHPLIRYIEDQFDMKRRVTLDVVAEVTRYANDFESETERRVNGAVHDAKVGLQAKLQYATDREDKARALVTKQDDVIKGLRAQLEEKRALSDKREHASEGRVRVTIARDIAGWTVADLEEIAYRLRLGGAEDDTQVSLGVREIQAYVVDPNMVTLAPVGKKVAVPEDDEYREDDRSHLIWPLRHWHAIALTVCGALAGTGAAGLLGLFG